MNETREVLKELDTPEELALTEEIRDAVNLAVEGLCEEQRIAIILRELRGLSYSQMAAAMSCPVGTVRSRVFRAREAIDHRLRRVFDDGRDARGGGRTCKRTVPWRGQSTDDPMTQMVRYTPWP